MRRKYTARGIPRFAYGGQVGNEIIDFQRQYNPFLGDYPTYGMVGSQQPGAWLFFDDAWRRSQVPQSPSNEVAPPPAMAPMGPVDTGPDGGGADRYGDDWRGYGTDVIGRAIDPGQWSSATAVEALAGQRGLDAQLGQYSDDMMSGYGPVATQGPEMVLGQDMQSAPPAGWGYGGEDDVFAANMAAEALAAQALSGQTTPASNVGFNADFVPAEAYVSPGPVEMQEPLSGFAPAYASPEQMAAMQAELQAYAANPGGGWTVGIGIDPKGIGASLSPEAKYGVTESINGLLGGKSLADVDPEMMAVLGSELGQQGLAAAGQALGSGAPGFAVDEDHPGTPGVQSNQAAQTGLNAVASMARGYSSAGTPNVSDLPAMSIADIPGLPGGQPQAPSAGPIGLGGLAAPGSPGFGAAAALADLYGLTQDIGLGLVANQAMTPVEPGNTVAGPVSGVVSAPSMDPLAGVSQGQIDALAQGYHDQAPAIGAPSPVAGFDTQLAAQQAAAERGRGGIAAARGNTQAEDLVHSGKTAEAYTSYVDRNGNYVVDRDKEGATGMNTPGHDQTGGHGAGGTTDGKDPGAGKDANSDTSGNSAAEGGTGGTGQGSSGSSGDPGGTNGGEGNGPDARKAGGRIRSRGLPDMAARVADAGRGNDTVLAHITPREAMRLDAAMGGPSINPDTGLREYGFFDDIGDFLGGAAKAVAPIAGGVLGGMFGGPLGAAAGSALGTALVGGSLQESLLSGAVGGIGAYAAPKLQSGLGGLFGGGNGMEQGASMMGANGMQTGGGSQSYAGGGDSGGSWFSGLTGNPLAMVGLGAAGGLGAGYLLGGGAGDDDYQSNKTQPAPSWTPRQGTLAPRTYVPYGGDYSTYGQVGGGAGHSFYDNVNPGVQWYAEGGSVEPKAPSKEKMRDAFGRELLGGADYTNPAAVLQIAEMAMPKMPPPSRGLPAPQLQEPQQLQAPVAPTGQGMMGQWQQQAMPPWLIDHDTPSDNRIANLIWRAPGGGVQGPGNGQSDQIPAMLSDGEYVVSADVVSALGAGSNNAGADRLDQMMANVRKHRSQGGKGLPPMAKSPMEYMGR